MEGMLLSARPASLRGSSRMPDGSRHSLHAVLTYGARSPPYAPFCSDGIGLSVLPGALRLLGLAPVGCRRLTSSRVNVLAGRFILDAGCVVSAPLPALSGPSACAGPPYLGRGDVPQQPRKVTVGRPRSPGRPRHPEVPIWSCRPIRGPTV